jgi:hypothetical protein
LEVGENGRDAGLAEQLHRILCVFVEICVEDALAIPPTFEFEIALLGDGRRRRFVQS